METTMIEMSGTLTVKAIHGRNGIFRTGELETSIGDFKVKDKILEQFEEGTYTGRFVVDRIFPECYMWYGKVITEIRAKLADVDIDQDDPEPPVSNTPAPAEPDPAELASDGAAESGASKSTALSATRVDVAEPASAALEQPSGDAETKTAVHSTADNEAAELVRVFGDELATAILAGHPVKLDPTVDRAVFREQRLVLKEQYDYAFKASEQTWYKQ
jgi:hypothetical protein